MPVSRSRTTPWKLTSIRSPRPAPEYQSIVDAIRHRDVKLSVLATIDKGINKAGEVQSTARFAKPLHERIGAHAAGAWLGATPGVYEGIHDIKEGHYDKLPVDVGTAVAGAVLPASRRQAGRARCLSDPSGGHERRRYPPASTGGRDRGRKPARGQAAGKRARFRRARDAAAVGSAVAGTLATQ